MPQTRWARDTGAPRTEAYLRSLSRPIDFAARERQLQEAREQLRTLFELSKAVVLARDPASLQTAIGPTLQRVVSHDAASVCVLEDSGRRLGLCMASQIAGGWTDERASRNRPDTEPVATWLVERRAIDVDVGTFDWTGREAFRSDLEENGVTRVGVIPLATPRGPLGLLVLYRRASRPFTDQELERSSQAAAQDGARLRRDRQADGSPRTREHPLGGEDPRCRAIRSDLRREQGVRT